LDWVVDQYQVSEELSITEASQAIDTLKEVAAERRRLPSCPRSQAAVLQSQAMAQHAGSRPDDRGWRSGTEAGNDCSAQQAMVGEPR
jgi:hypothetical protein